MKRISVDKVDDFVSVIPRTNLGPGVPWGTAVVAACAARRIKRVWSDASPTIAALRFAGVRPG